MTRIISQINPETGRRQKIGGVEGETFKERTQNVAGAFDVSNKKALRLSNEDIAKKVGTIPVSTLNTPVTPAKVPSVPTSTVATDLVSDLGTQADSYQKNLDRQAQTSKDAEATSFEKLLVDTLNAPTQEGLQAQAYKEGGVDTLQAELTDINQQLLNESESLRKQIEAIQTRAGTATKGEKDYQVQELTRNSLRKQADLAIIQLSRQGRFNDAKAVADRAVDAQLAQSKRKLDVMGMAYERNRDLFTKDEQRAFESGQADRKRALDAEAFKMQADYEQKIRVNDPLYQAQLHAAQIANAELQGAGQAPDTTLDQLSFLEKSAKEAKALKNESGQGSITKYIGDVVGGSRYRQLEQYTNTLKSNMLTLATDPNIKKFFGPQMSNADVLLMTSAGTTLNPASQSPKQMEEEIERLEDFFARAKTAVKTGQAIQPSGETQTPITNKLITAPDGTVIEIVD